MTLKKQKNILALDIGSCSLKLAEAQIKETGLVLKKCQQFSLPIDKAVNADFLKSILQKSSLKNSKVIVSVQGQGVILRYLILPKVDKNELKGALKFELEKNIPFAIDDVFIDGQIIKPIDDKVLVLAVAAKKKFIQDYLNLLAKAEIYPEIIDCNCLALANIFGNLAIENKKKSNALLNLGCNFTNLSILKDDIPLFNRDIPIGSSLLNKKISDHLNISLNEAENLKLKPGDKINEIRQACESVWDDLIAEIKSSFDYFGNKEDVNIECVYLTGGLANFPEINKLFSQSFNIECKLLDPLSYFNKADDFDGSLMEGSSYFAVCLGLILRG